jgi:hypothetical protein
MVASAALVLRVGKDLHFTGDELFYFARLVERGGGLAHYHALGPGYLLAPHNGHLQLVGRLVYEALFALFGTAYAPFRIVEVASLLACVGLFYELARAKIGPVAALVPSVLLLFFGFAWEPMLWPFDMHTLIALAAGLGALLALERDGRRGDALACALLVLSTATIEVGIAFSVGVAVSVLARPDRARRLWIFLVPLLLYAAWSLWATRFDQTQLVFSDARLIPVTIVRALGAVLSSILGLNDLSAATPIQLVGSHPWGVPLAALALAALAFRVYRSRVPTTLWVMIAILVTYWSLLALGQRPATSSRYVFVGAVGVLLIAADAVNGWRLPRGGAALAVALALAWLAIAIPPNIAKLHDGQRLLQSGEATAKAEYGILDLAGTRARPGYKPFKDPRVIEAGGSQVLGLAAGPYDEAARRIGSLGYSPDELAGAPVPAPATADATLAGALRIHLAGARGVRPSGCSHFAPRGGAGLALPLPRGGIALRVDSAHPEPLGLGRFATGAPSVQLGEAAPGTWRALRIPRASAPRTWRLYADAPLTICPLRS